MSDTRLEYDIVFRCDAHHQVGFGHLGRCIDLARMHLRKSPHADHISFTGQFSEEAFGVIRELLPDVQIHSSKEGISGLIGVMDMMFEPSDPEYYNIHMIEVFCRTVSRSILLTSSRSVPSALGVDVVIGHLLEVRPDNKKNYKLFGGLEYTPISEDFKPFQKRRTKKEKIENIMVAFGGGRDLDGPRLTLKALHQIGFKGRVDILISPLSPYNRSGLKRHGFPFQITIWQNLPSVAPLIYNADLIIGSYGHITFEAMCLGTPFVVVGLKNFQIDYARQLDREGLLICAGRLGQISATQLGRIIEELDSDALILMGRRGKQKVDKFGITRIARIIEAELERVRQKMLLQHESKA